MKKVNMICKKWKELTKRGDNMEIKTKIINGKEKRPVSDKLRQIAKASKVKEWQHIKN